MNELLQSAVALIAICNPLGNAPIFLAMVGDIPVAQKRTAALSASVAVLGILTISALLGRWILELFSISIAAFRVAGGLVIVLMSLEMLRGDPSRVHHEAVSPDELRDKILVPFAMPLVAGPGAIAAVITLAVTHAPTGVPLEALAASITVSVLLCAVLLFVSARENLISGRAQRLITRFMGLVLVAVGVQLGLDGLTEFLAGETSPP